MNRIKLEHWLAALIAFVVQYVATAGLSAIGAAAFNVALNWKQLLITCASSAIIGTLLYLKQSPIPLNDSSVTLPDAIKNAFPKNPTIPLIFAGFLVLGLSSCATQPINTQTAIQDSIPYLEPAVAIACGSALQFAVTDADRKEIANEIDGIAKAVRTLSTGVAPTVDQLKSVIDLWAPKQDKYAELSIALGALYAGVYPQLIKNPNPQLALQVLEAIAKGCEDAAAPYAQ